MKKIVITILALLFIPVMAGATDDALSFPQNTNLDVGGVILEVQANGLADDMVVDATSVTFTLSTNSTLVIRSAARDTLSNNFGKGILCGDTYSQLSVSGTSFGTSFVVTPSGSACLLVTGGGTVTSGGGGGVAIPITPITPTTPTTPITTTGEVTATVVGGGKTTLTTDENATAAVSLPVNAVSVSTVIAITTESKATVTTSRPIPSNRNVVGSYVYNYGATASGAVVSSFNSAVTLTFTYTDEQISGLTESSLRVFYWKESTSEWVVLTTMVDANANTLVADTTHFTYFAIMALTEGVKDEGDLVEEEAPATTTIVDGNLIRNPNAFGLAQFDIYIVKLVGTKKFKRLILSPHVFESYEHFDKDGNGSPWNDVLDVNQTTMDQQTTSDLVRAVGDPKVYRLIASGDTGTKRWMNMTAVQFIAQGHNSDSIYEINATDRNAYTAGVDITVE
ncbi:hypothetical protein KKH35_02015 [Patescibacteria group bacterium]|nr:hypothetical protein [Patescibacteria group bacterium]